MRASFESIFRKPDYGKVLEAVQRVKDFRAVDREGNTVLGMATYYGHLDACRWLLQQGCRIEHAGRDHRTPLMMALHALSGMGPVHERFVETIALLLQEGAKVGCRDEDGRTPLHFAVRSSR